MKWLVLALTASLPLLIHSHVTTTPLETGNWNTLLPHQADLFTYFKAISVIFLGATSFFYFVAKKQFDYLVGVYLILVVASVLKSSYTHVSIFGSPLESEGLLVLSSYVLISCLVREVFQKDEDKESLALFLVVALLIEIPFCLIELTTNTVMTPWILREPAASLIFQSKAIEAQTWAYAGSICGSFDSVNHLGLFLAILGPFFFGLFNEEKEIHWLLFFITTLVFALMAQSRLAILSMAVSALYVATKNRKGAIAALAIVVAGTCFLLKPQVKRQDHYQIDVNGSTAFVANDGKSILIRSDFEKREFHILTNPKDDTTFKWQAEGPSLKVFEKGLDLELLSLPSGLGLVVSNLAVQPVHAPHLNIPLRLFDSRGFMWGRTLPLLKHRWLYGYGPGTFIYIFPEFDIEGKINAGFGPRTLIERPHNWYLQQWFGSGFLALLVLLLFISDQCTKSHSKFSGARNLAVLGFLVAGFFTDSTVQVSPYFWIILGL